MGDVIVILIAIVVAGIPLLYLALAVVSWLWEVWCHLSGRTPRGLSGRNSYSNYEPNATDPSDFDDGSF